MYREHTKSESDQFIVYGNIVFLVNTTHFYIERSHEGIGPEVFKQEEGMHHEVHVIFAKNALDTINKIVKFGKKIESEPGEKIGMKLIHKAKVTNFDGAELYPFNEHYYLGEIEGVKINSIIRGSFHEGFESMENIMDLQWRDDIRVDYLSTDHLFLIKKEIDKGGDHMKSEVFKNLLIEYKNAMFSLVTIKNTNFTNEEPDEYYHTIRAITDDSGFGYAIELETQGSATIDAKTGLVLIHDHSTTDQDYSIFPFTMWSDKNILKGINVLSVSESSMAYNFEGLKEKMNAWIEDENQYSYDEFLQFKEHIDGIILGESEESNESNIIPESAGESDVWIGEGEELQNIGVANSVEFTKNKHRTKLDITELIPKQRYLDAMVMLRNQTTSYALISKKMTRALLDEIGELSGATRAAKHWSVKEPDWDHVKEEYVDILHFLVSKAIECDVIHIDPIAITDPKTDELTKEDDLVQLITELDVLCMECFVVMRSNDVHSYHFESIFKKFAEIGYVLGYNANEIHKAYDDKFQVNIERQQNNY